MTTQLPIPKERLEGISRGEKCYTHDDVVLVVSALLAAYEQEPSGYLWRTKTHLVTTAWRYAESFPGYVAGESFEVRPQYDHPAPSIPAVPELASVIAELTSAIRSINRAPHHIVKGVDDDEPCYWQRKEWIDWILELASNADEKIRAAMLNGGKS